MQLTVAHIGARRSSQPGGGSLKSQYDNLTRLYLDRIAPYHSCRDEAFPAEADFLAWLANPGRQGNLPRQPPTPVLLDSTGRQLDSAGFATWLGARRDQGAQHIAFAVGPANGWSPAAIDFARTHAGLVLSFGPITMAHGLARLVLAEQLYRACTILAGHPYHSGH